MDIGDSTIAGIITAFATLITAVGGLIVAIKVLVPNFRETRKIHTLVNKQYTDVQQFNKALISALVKAGIDVPEDQSKLE